MKPAICIGSLPAEELKLISSAGFSSVELGFSHIAFLTPEEIREYLDFLSSLGLTPVAANGFFPQFPEEKGFFRPSFDICEIREYIAEAFEKSSGVHFSSIAFGSGGMRRIPDGFDKNRAFDFTARLISDEIVPYLEKYDAVLSIEELRKEETNFINSCAEAKQLACLVNHPRVGVLCDFYHMISGNETPSDIPGFADKITHVHIASPSNRRSIPYIADGDDEKYAEFFAVLAKFGYDGYISSEGGIAEKLDHAKAYADCRAFFAKTLEKI